MSIPIGPVRKRQPGDSTNSWQPAKSQRSNEWWQGRHGGNEWADDGWRADAWKAKAEEENAREDWSTLDAMWEAPTDSSPSKGSSKGYGKNSIWISEENKADIKQWQECTKVGSPLPGTFLIPVKTPFEGPLQQKAVRLGLISDEDAFTKADLLQIAREKGTPIGLVIDLVNTDKYYKGFTEADGIEYQKVPIPGRTVPGIADVKAVFKIIDDYVKRRPANSNLHVAMHCTHGVNRTGFFATAYMLIKTPQGRQMSSEEAVSVFESKRGVKMDKVYLVDTLKEIVASRPPPKK